MADELEKLEINDISSLTTSSVEEFRSEIESREVPVNDLEILRSAEQSGKNREKVLEIIDRQMEKQKVSQKLGLAEDELEHIEGLMNEVTELESAEFDGDQAEDVSQEDLLDLVGGTVADIKKYVTENNPSVEVMQTLLNSEKKVKDRKTAKKFLEKKIRQKKVEKDLEKTSEDIEKLESDLETVEKDSDIDEESENGEQEPETEEEDSEDEEDSDDKENNEEASEEEKEDSKNDKEEDKSEEESEEAESEEETEEKEEGDSKGENEEVSEFEKKKEILEDIDMDVPDNELENIPIDELKSIRDDKKEREGLIGGLKDEGLDPEKLQQSSTEDLRKIAEELEIDVDEGRESSDGEEDDSDKSQEEMREEAEEDLQMLMGAVRDSEDEEEEDEGGGPREKIQNFREKISARLNSDDKGQGDDDGSMNDSDVKEVLDKYSKLESDREVAVKTAHVMKGYLETELGIKRELTYQELAEQLPEDSDNMKQLADFFETMNREQYIKKIDVEADEVIALCKHVVEDL
ncbi:hypothetical protein [Candidatus Nanohalovita haloferacivicina]|uniref:hypothetical protein n=1 Tax=Candidatus Nanohalovita haloferacivicina TaxID=2978046 RepID=UPI00325FBA7F|nr:hypothetical protein HBNXNv_0190 [Candidatus Nanohalobia archaeon BNXNv]